MVEASGSNATRVPLADGLPLLEASGEAHEHESQDEAYDHGDYDPHVWQDVSNIIAEVVVIRDALTTADPSNADAYSANATTYTTQLQELDTSIRTMAATVPAENRELVTSHDALAYFAHAYGFTIAGTAFGSVSTEAGDPSAGEIARLIDQIKASGVPAIFVENVEGGDLMEQIANDAGVTLAPTLYTDALGLADSPGATYIAMMTYNATTIVTALGVQVGQP
jgi:ABC-type Zn uptake system ZnuABC Zn-binding protein ZnuA